MRNKNPTNKTVEIDTQPSAQPAGLFDSNNSSAGQTIAFACLLLAAAHIVINRIVWSGIPLQTDSGMWAYFGGRILDGAVPYADFWDNKPPGIFYVFAINQWLFGRAQGVSLLWMDAVVTAIVCGLVFLAARRLTSILPAALATLALSLVFCHRILADWGNNGEKFVAVYEFAAFLCVLKIIGFQRSLGSFDSPQQQVGDDGKKSNAKVYLLLICVGAFCGLAATFRQTGIALFLALHLAFAWCWWRKRLANRQALAAFASLWVGFAMVWGAIVTWMFAVGNLDDFWQQVVLYDLQRGAGEEGDRSRLLDPAHWETVTANLTLASVLLLPALVGIFVFVRECVKKTTAIRGDTSHDVANSLFERRNKIAAHTPLDSTIGIDRKTALVVALAYFATTMIFLPLAPHGYGHYLLQAAPPAALFFAIAAASIIERCPRNIRVFALVAYLIVSYHTLADHFEFLFVKDTPARQAYAMMAAQTDELVAAIREHSEPDDTVLIWPMNDAASYYAGRTTPLEWGMTIDMFRGRITRMTPPFDEVLENLVSNPPAVIVDVTPMRWTRLPGDIVAPMIKPDGYSLFGPPDPNHTTAVGRTIAPMKAWITKEYGDQIRAGGATFYFHNKSPRPIMPSAEELREFSE